MRESLKPGAVVSEVAQRHGVNRWQLYDWRRKVRIATGGSAVPGDQARSSRPKRNPKCNGSMSKPVEALPAFAPVVMTAPAMPITGPETLNLFAEGFPGLDLGERVVAAGRDWTSLGLRC